MGKEFSINFVKFYYKYRFFNFLFTNYRQILQSISVEHTVIPLVLIAQDLELLEEDVGDVPLVDRYELLRLGRVDLPIHLKLLEVDHIVEEEH